MTTKNIIISVVSSLVGGALAGLLFGWLIGLFVNSKLWIQGTKINIESDETILFETGANHLKGAEAVGGKLYLTTKRLTFKSHKLNIQKHELSINLSDIEKAERFKTLGIENNGLAVTISPNDTIERFVVQQPKEWIYQLKANNELQHLAKG
ncbi:MAG: GRAM domain-containing protein [Ginsengibacter sp.]